MLKRRGVSFKDTHKWRRHASLWYYLTQFLIMAKFVQTKMKISQTFLSLNHYIIL